MTDANDRVLMTRDGPLAEITINRPDRFNAFDGSMLQSLWERFRAAARDPGIRAVLLTGAGKAFCAGGDLKAVLDRSPNRPGEWFYIYAAVYHQCILEIRTMEKPVIAAVNGAAAGGGFSLALACDLRIMARSAVLRQAYTSNGLSIDGGGSFTLPRIVGLARALEIAMLDEPIDADRALEWGLTHRVVEDDALMDEARLMARRLSAKATRNLGRVKRLMNSAFDTSLESRLEQERFSLSESANDPEGREGLQAFVEKRKPEFHGKG